MERRSWAWGWVGAAAAIAACGGDPFVLGDASPFAAPREGGSDGSAFNTDVFCANQTCTGGTRCCTSIMSPDSSNCRRGMCTGCNTELPCSSDANCPQGACCIHLDTSNTACAAGRYVAQCLVGTTCASGWSHLCDPNGLDCPNGRNCLTGALDLLAVGLPANVANGSYGVCSK